MASNNFRYPDLIGTKRDGKVLSRDQINHFIKGVVQGHVHGSQLGAMLMAIFFHGMETDEMVGLTHSMLNSGETLSWPDDWKDLVVDKHSSGGVGDKVSLPLAPALAACGLKVKYYKEISRNNLYACTWLADATFQILGARSVALLLILYWKVLSQILRV